MYLTDARAFVDLFVGCRNLEYVSTRYIFRYDSSCFACHLYRSGIAVAPRVSSMEHHLSFFLHLIFTHFLSTLLEFRPVLVPTRGRLQAVAEPATPITQTLLSGRLDSFLLIPPTLAIFLRDFLLEYHLLYLVLLVISYVISYICRGPTYQIIFTNLFSHL